MPHAMKTTNRPPDILKAPPRAVLGPARYDTSRRSHSETSSRGLDSPGVASSGSGENNAIHKTKLDHGTWRPNIDEEKYAIRYYSPGESDAEDSMRLHGEKHDMQQNTLWALLYLAALAPILSVVIAIASAFLMLFVVFSAPFRLCIRSMTDCKSCTINILYPLLALHHRGVSSIPFAPRSSTSRPEPSLSQERRTGSVWRMVLVLLFSPIVAIPFMIASWVVGCFWTLSELVSLDDSQRPELAHQRDNDGEISAQALVRWWTMWLDGCK